MDRLSRSDHMQEDADTDDQGFPSELQDGLSMASSLETTDALVLEIVEGLRSQLVKSTPSVRNGLEMKHILLLLVKAFHDLCEQMAFEKIQWLQKIQEVIGQQGSTPRTLREQTSQVIVEKFQAAPWGHVKRHEQDRSDTVHTILATYKAMVEFIKALVSGLQQKAEQGVDLKQFDVEEMQSEEEEEADTSPSGTTRTTIPKIIVHPPKRTPKGSGNFNHGLFTTWTVAEWVHLLKTFQANPTEMGRNIAQMHNDGYWVPKGRDVKRSTDSVRQQYKKLMGKGTEETLPKVPEKIAELEGRQSKNADVDDEDDVDQEDEEKGEQGDEEND